MHKAVGFLLAKHFCEKSIWGHRCKAHEVGKGGMSFGRFVQSFVEIASGSPSELFKGAQTMKCKL